MRAGVSDTPAHRMYDVVVGIIYDRDHGFFGKQAGLNFHLSYDNCLGQHDSMRSKRTKNKPHRARVIHTIYTGKSLASHGHSSRFDSFVSTEGYGGRLTRQGA